MANIESNIQKLNDIEISADAPHSEALMNKFGANINGLIDGLDGLNTDLNNGLNAIITVLAGSYMLSGLEIHTSSGTHTLTLGAGEIGLIFGGVGGGGTPWQAVSGGPGPGSIGLNKGAGALYSVGMKFKQIVFP